MIIFKQILLYFTSCTQLHIMVLLIELNHHFSLFQNKYIIVKIYLISTTMHCKSKRLSSLNCKIPHFLTQRYQVQVRTHNLPRLFTLRLYAAPMRGVLSYLIDTGYRKTLIRSKERGMWAADDLRDTIKQALILSNGVL